MVRTSRGGQNTRPNPKKFGFGLDRIANEKLSTRSGCDPIRSPKKEKKNSLNLKLNTLHFTVYTLHNTHAHRTPNADGKHSQVLTIHKHCETHKQHTEQNQSTVSAAETKGLKSDFEPSSICCWNWHTKGHMLPQSVPWSTVICCRDLYRDLLPFITAICAVIYCRELLPSAAVVEASNPTRPELSPFVALWPKPNFEALKFHNFNLSWYVLYSYICLIINYLLCNWLLYDCCNYVFLNVSNKIKKIGIFMILLWINFY